ncbi:MAG: phage tail tape measure protein, partial [Candidatus Zixiibacteriota bacterium]
MAELQVKIVSDSSGGKETVRSLKEIKAAAAANETQFQRTGAAGTASAASIARGTRVAAQAQLVMTAALERNRALLLTQARGGFLQSIQRGAASALEGVQRLTASISTKLQPALRLVALAGVAAFGFAIKSAVKFEETLSRITGLVGIAADEVKSFEKPLLDIAKATAKGPNELAEALFFITSAGARGDKALKILAASAKAAAAGLGETKTVADAVTSAVNAYGEANLTASQSTDVLTATVREGKAEADSIAQSLGRVLPIASQLGVTFDQVGATVAALTRVGLDANEATTSLRATLSLINKPGKEAVDTLRDLSKQNIGVALSFDEIRATIREKGLLAGLNQIKEAVGGNDQELTKIFPNLRANAGVFSLLGANADIAAGIFERMTDVTGATDKAFAAFAATTSFDVKQSLVVIQVAFKEIADNLLPAVAKAFVKLASAVKTTVNLFTDLGEAIAHAVSGADEPLERATEQLKEIQNQLIVFESDRALKGLQDGGTAFLNNLFGINIGMIKLEGSLDNQVKQLKTEETRLKQIIDQINEENRLRELQKNTLEEIEEIVVNIKRKSTSQIIDTDLLDKAKEALSDLRGDITLMVADLGNLTSLGQQGIGLAEDAAEAESIFKALQGQVKITKDEVIALVRQKRAL